MSDNSSSWKLKIFYDGACPICSREMRFLMKRNANGTIVFDDTSQPGFDPKKYGISTDTNRLIHGMLPDGKIIKGMEVLRRAYKEVGLGFVLAATGWPLIKPVADLGYRLFARYRIPIGKLLGRSCKADSCS